MIDKPVIDKKIQTLESLVNRLRELYLDAYDTDNVLNPSTEAIYRAYDQARAALELLHNEKDEQLFNEILLKSAR